MPENGRDQNGSSAADSLDCLYQELRLLASKLLISQRSDHTLQATALVNEAFLRLAKHGDWKRLGAQGFYCYAAKAMRSVLVDHARRRQAKKRGANSKRIPLDAIVDIYENRADDLVALDDALDRLAAQDVELVRLIELRFFGGLTESETATVLQTSARTVRRRWALARRWLYRDLSEGARDE